MVEWKDKRLDYQENKTALLLESAKRNINHGDRLSSNDKKRVARYIASTDPECNYTGNTLAEKLGVCQQTVNIWISDIRARQKTNRNSIIIRLSRLGWTQEKISETVGINQQRISQITNNTIFGNIGNLLSQGHGMKYIATHYPMAGDGVVIDVCLLFERKCQAFDLTFRGNRPEIEQHHWGPGKKTWPVTKKADGKQPTE